MKQEPPREPDPSECDAQNGLLIAGRIERLLFFGRNNEPVLHAAHRVACVRNTEREANRVFLLIIKY